MTIISQMCLLDTRFATNWLTDVVTIHELSLILLYVNVDKAYQCKKQLSEVLGLSD